MVDFDAVLGEVKRTAYVGIGTFASASVGNVLDGRVPGGNVGVASAQALAGAGGAYVAQSRMGGRQTNGLDFDMGEAARHAAYGVGGSGFAEAADSLTGETSQQGQLVEVTSRAQHSEADSQSDEQEGSDRERISVDV